MYVLYKLLSSLPSKQFLNIKYQIIQITIILHSGYEFRHLCSLLHIAVIILCSCAVEDFNIK